MFPHALKKAAGPNSVYACFILQALLFNRVVDDLNSWMDEVENHLMSEDHGKDLTSVNSLLKKHQVGTSHMTGYAQHAWTESRILFAPFLVCSPTWIHSALWTYASCWFAELFEYVLCVLAANVRR